MRRAKTNLYFVAVFILLLMTINSCRKKDHINPQVQILTPNTYETFNAFEEIAITVEVSDNEGLDWLSIDIVTANNTRVSNVRSFNFENDNEKTINTTLIISNTSLVSGDYYIRALVSDGINETSDFQEIHINQVPKELDKVLLVKTNNNEIILDYFQSGLETGSSFEGDFGFIQINSFNHKILLGAQNPSKIIGLEASDLEVSSETVIIDDNSDPFYLGSHYDALSRKTFVSTNDGKVRAFDKNGDLLSTILIEDGFRPYAIATYEDYIIIEQRSFDQTEGQLVSYHKNTGAFMQSTPIGMKVVEILVNNGRIFLVGNQDIFNGQIAEYDYDNNFYNLIDEWVASSPIRCATNTPFANQIAYADDNFTKMISVNSTSIDPVNIWTSQPHAMKFDEVSNLIFGVNESELFTMDLNNNETTLILVDGYSQLELVYNR